MERGAGQYEFSFQTAWNEALPESVGPGSETPLSSS